MKKIIAYGLILSAVLLSGFVIQRNQLKWATTIAPETANRIAGWNGSGNAAVVTIGSGLQLSGGSLSSTGTGITNSGAANEIVKSDGTNVVGSGVYSTANGNLRLGDAGLAGNRTISVLGSGGSESLTLEAGVAGPVIIAEGLLSFAGFASVVNGRDGVSAEDGGSIEFIGGNAAGAGDFDGGNIYLTGGAASGSGIAGRVFIRSGANDYQVINGLVNSATLDFPSTASTAVADLTITVTGAAVGDDVAIGVPNGSVTATATFTGWVSASNTVTIRFSPKATEDPASGTFSATVIKN